jgi:hypothetical protein
MPKPKKKLTSAQRAARKRRKKETEIIFINGKQKRIKREPSLDGMSAEQFIRQYADPITLHHNEMWDESLPLRPFDFVGKAERTNLKDLRRTLHFNS